MTKKKPFKTLLGKRLIIPFPTVDEKTESGIILTPEAQKEKEKENMEKTLRFTIVQRGEECETTIQEGDDVFVETRSLQPGSAETLFGADGKIEFLIIPERAVVGIY